MMIVRNEALTLPRLAESLAGKIQHWTVVDTGSVDNTIQVAEQVFGDTPGQVIVNTWKGFGPSRNVALDAAEGITDWLLTMDADQTLVGELGDLGELGDVDCIEAEERSGTLSYWVPRLIRSGRGWRWKGRTHEYLDLAGARRATTDSFFVLHHADGSNRADKFERDAELLLEDWAEEHTPRTAFYLARTFDDIGKNRLAEKWYEIRLSMDGWAEEVFYSRYRLGTLLLSFSPDEGRGILWGAWSMRPHRVEPLVTLAENYRTTGNWELAWLSAHTGLEHLGPNKPDDLFVDMDAKWRILYEASIAAWYTGYRDEGRNYIQQLLGLDLPEPYRSSVQQNASFY